MGGIAAALFAILIAGATGNLGLVVAVVIYGSFYFVPALIASYRRHRNTLAIFVLQLSVLVVYFLALTPIDTIINVPYAAPTIAGLIAIVWAFTANPPEASPS
jgi:hypothetical protein